MIAELIHPNWHAALLHLPIGLLVAGVLTELLAGRSIAASSGARWMILLGALTSVPAALAGAFGFRQIVVAGAAVDTHDAWHELVAASAWSQAQWEHMGDHAWLEALAAGVSLVVACAWLAGSDATRARFRAPALLGLLVAVGLMVAGAWHGGEMVYRLGMAVGEPAAAPGEGLGATLLQAHVVGAGFAVALLAGALTRVVRARSELAAGSRPPLRWPFALGALAVAGTAVGGVALAGEGLDRSALEKWLAELDSSVRLLAHAILGGSVLVAACIGLLVPRAIASRPVLAAAFAALLLVGAAGQVWVGTLLLFDSPHGPLTRFSRPGEGAVEPEARQPAGVVEASATLDTASIIALDARGFDPATATIRAGELVEWRNAGDVTRAVTVEAAPLDGSAGEAAEAGFPIRSADLPPGASWRHRFTVAGEYRYRSGSGEAERVGTLVVEPPAESRR